MAGNFGSGGDEELVSSINITPLVDVVLVLLVIFLMTAPVIYQSAIKVQLPKARTGEETQKSPLNFTITKEGTLMLDKEVTNWEKLSLKLGDLTKTNPEQTAVISADQATPHGLVIRLMDVLRQSGINRFAMNVEGPVGNR